MESDVRNRDTIEFYDGESKMVAYIDSSIVPMVGSKISIRMKKWVVVGVTYALDQADNHDLSKMRANVDLKACK